MTEKRKKSILMENREIDDMENIIDPLLMRKRSGKYIAAMLFRSGFGRLPKENCE